MPYRNRGGADDPFSDSPGYFDAIAGAALSQYVPQLMALSGPMPHESGYNWQNDPSLSPLRQQLQQSKTDRLGQAGQALGYSAVGSNVEQFRQKNLQKQGAQEWTRIAKVFADPKANLTSEQKAHVLNQFQQQYGALSMPNPIDITTAEDESDPKIQIANARQKVRGMKGYDPFWESLIKTNKDGEIDYKDLIEWRKLEGKDQNPAQDMAARKQAYEFDKKQHEEFRPESPGDEATPEEIDQYKESFARWQGGQRNLYNQYFGDTEQHKMPMPPQAETQQPPRPALPPQEQASKLGVSYVKSGDQFDELVQQGLLSPGDSFVDDVGHVWQIDEQGVPRAASNVVGQ